MTTQLSELGWPEVQLKNVKLNGFELTFQAFDLVEIGTNLKYELFNVSIKNIEFLKVEIIPFRDGAYQEPETPVHFGSFRENGEGFEGVMFGNPFSQTEAEYFWVSAEVIAKKIEVERTNTFELQTRKNLP